MISRPDHEAPEKKTREIESTKRTEARKRSRSVKPKREQAKRETDNPNNK